MVLSTLVIGNDTGLLHLAVALNQRVVMLMGPTRPDKIGPYANLDWAIISQKGTDIADIGLTEAIHAVTDTLSQLERADSQVKH
jgi:ADP-heptose:LPS heptosyltransferase